MFVYVFVCCVDVQGSQNGLLYVDSLSINCLSSRLHVCVCNCVLCRRPRFITSSRHSAGCSIRTASLHKSMLSSSDVKISLRSAADWHTCVNPCWMLVGSLWDSFVICSVSGKMQMENNILECQHLMNLLKTYKAMAVQKIEVCLCHVV